MEQLNDWIPVAFILAWLLSPVFLIVWIYFLKRWLDQVIEMAYVMKNTNTNIDEYIDNTIRNKGDSLEALFMIKGEINICKNSLRGIIK